MKSKILLSIATLGTLAIGGMTMASAQSVTPTTSSPSGTTHTKMVLTDAQKAIMSQAKTMFKAGNATGAKALLTANGINFGGGMRHGGGMGNMKALDAAIASGNFASFQTLAVNSPLANISQATFNLLTPQFLAKQNAETQIQSILTSAGVTFSHGPKTN